MRSLVLLLDPWYEGFGTPNQRLANAQVLIILLFICVTFFSFRACAYKSFEIMDVKLF